MLDSVYNFYDFSGRGGSIRSALRRRRAKDNWLRLVTTMRGVNIADCENLFIKDEYRHIVFTEEDMDAVLRGEYVVTTPTPDTDTRQDPSKRVRWRESLEEMFYEEPDTECVVVDLGPDKARPPPRRQVRRQFSVEEPGAGAGQSRPGAGRPQSHSAPSSPTKTPSSAPPCPGVSTARTTELRRSRSAERGSARGAWGGGGGGGARDPGAGHEYGEVARDKVRRVRCRHGSSMQARQHIIIILGSVIIKVIILKQENMWLYGGLNSFNRRVKNRISVTLPFNNHYYSYKSQPRASRD